MCHSFQISDLMPTPIFSKKHVEMDGVAALQRNASVYMNESPTRANHTHFLSLLIGFDIKPYLAD